MKKGISCFLLIDGLKSVIAFASVKVVFRELLSLAMKSSRKSEMLPMSLCLSLICSYSALAVDLLIIERLCSACLIENFLTVLPM